MYKNEKKIEFVTSLLPHLKLSLILIIALHLCGLNNNIKPNSTEDCWTLQQTHNTTEERQIFLVFSIFQTSKQSKNKQSKNLFGFFFKADQN